MRHVLVIGVSVGLLAAAVPVWGQTPAAKPPAGQQEPAAAPKKMFPPQRGIAEVGYLPPKTTVEGTNVVTTFQVKNLSAGSIAGFQISEFWYDKAGNPVQGTGDRQRLRQPLQPGETATIVLRSPKVTGMARNQYQFAHGNGTIKATVLKTLK